jgi:two-component system sensor histidine kinase PilS (NtrC family)
MSDTELRRKVGWLIGVRAVVSTVLLGGAVVASVWGPGSMPVQPFFYLIAITYALTVVYAATLPYVDRHRWLIDLQVAADAIIVSAVIMVTGGIASVFSLLYVLPIMGASAVHLRRGGLLVATLSSLIYGGIVLGQYMAAAGLLSAVWLRTSPAMLPPASVAQYTVVLNVFGFFAVALLSGSLAENVRSTGARLARASTEIADLQALNQHVIDSLQSGLTTTDTEQRILTFNHAAEAITGVPAPLAVGRKIGEVLQFPPDLAEALDGGLRDGGARRVEFPFQTLDGRGAIEIGLSVVHLETPRGRAGFLVTFQDVTDFKRLERDARRRQRLAAVGEMAAGIAHEIRNPLASMSGSIQILRQELPLTAEQGQLMDIVLRESDRLNLTISSFLAYARPQRAASAPFDLSRTLDDTARLLRHSADVHDGHVIEIETPDGDVWYEADEGQIKQILWNLATNGLRAMEGGGRLRLRARRDPGDGGVIIEVQDEGIGIPAADLDGLFQPFHGSFAKGSGLGLAIVHRIVSDYQGEIRVSSKPGAGTTVSVRLPARVPAAA